MWQGDVSLGDAFVISLTGMLVVMLELTIIALFIVLLSKIIGLFRKNKAEPKNDKNSVEQPVFSPAVPEQTGTDSSGEISFEGISSEEAAIIMSAVSAESKTPLDRIKFKSIKKI